MKLDIETQNQLQRWKTNRKLLTVCTNKHDCEKTRKTKEKQRKTGQQRDKGNKQKKKNKSERTRGKTLETEEQNSEYQKLSEKMLNAKLLKRQH